MGHLKMFHVPGLFFLRELFNRGVYNTALISLVGEKNIQVEIALGLLLLLDFIPGINRKIYLPGIFEL